MVRTVLEKQWQGDHDHAVRDSPQHHGKSSPPPRHNGGLGVIVPAKQLQTFLVKHLRNGGCERALDVSLSETASSVDLGGSSNIQTSTS